MQTKVKSTNTRMIQSDATIWVSPNYNYLFFFIFLVCCWLICLWGIKKYVFQDWVFLQDCENWHFFLFFLLLITHRERERERGFVRLRRLKWGLGYMNDVYQYMYVYARDLRDLNEYMEERWGKWSNERFDFVFNLLLTAMLSFFEFKNCLRK